MKIIKYYSFFFLSFFYLSSANSSWITGTAIEVHGGGESPAYLNSAKPK